jgi:conjugative transfer signal peptidase TraF
MRTGQYSWFVLLRTAAFSALTVVMLFCGASKLRIRINTSPSLPIGLYQVASGPDATMVEFCPPEPFGSMANARGYRQAGNCPDGGAPLMKPIVARAGDIVNLSPSGMAVDYRVLPNSAPLTNDTASRPLKPWPFGAYRVQRGTIWVLSSYQSRSFDSRYFGPIPESIVRNHVRALLVLRR